MHQHFSHFGAITNTFWKHLEKALKIRLQLVSEKQTWYVLLCKHPEQFCWLPQFKNLRLQDWGWGSLVSQSSVWDSFPGISCHWSPLNASASSFPLIQMGTCTPATGKLKIHLTLNHSVMPLMLLRHSNTSCRLCCCEPPADVNMQFLPASRCAVFTCRLSHVILQERTLILLHCPSTVNSCTKSTSFHSILTSVSETRRTLMVSDGKALPEARTRTA